ncbi:MAG: di-trans,poly-cis-decaprenylcistransferase [Deltaproteobacteria bacterium]|nr:di-trans,poly-cis-decaprenylcistransferase [Deltaproteobacteria bacterium]
METRLPQHVAIIMDGNGRWAKERNLPRLSGHAKGASSVREITTIARKTGIRALTLYAFSTKNWSRPDEEVNGLMKLLGKYIKSERETLLSNDIRFSTIGNIDLLPENLKTSIAELKAVSRECASMDFCIALNYGGRDEIIRAVKKITALCMTGEKKPEDINEDTFRSYLDISHLPPVDLIIRTSGELRLSDFLLWESSYSELYFSEKYWPEFDENEFNKALNSYAKRERRFGKTTEQIMEK